MGSIDSSTVGSIAYSVTLDISDEGIGKRGLTKLQTSNVFGTQLAGIPGDNLAEIPLTFKVVVPPLVSTLHSNPAL